MLQGEVEDSKWNVYAINYIKSRYLMGCGKDD
jgi:hypothetical protein